MAVWIEKAMADGKGKGADANVISGGSSTYRTVKVIGKGGFGEAVLAKCSDDGRHYVIKKVDVSRMSEK